VAVTAAVNFALASKGRHLAQGLHRFLHIILRMVLRLRR
jgi:hypothetical protein